MQRDEVEVTINEMLRKLETQFSEGIFDKFIHYAVFPNFKNLEPQTRLDFTFPITSIAGANGTGKSTVLHALYGMPDDYSTSRFWFSTSLDAIDEGGELGQHRYFYGHKRNDLHDIVETRKARVTRTRSLDWWEPTKTSIGDGMKRFQQSDEEVEGKSKTRWNPVKRNVLYLNFKSELSAYDRYMYFGASPKGSVLKSKQDVVRRDANLIRRALDGKLEKYFGTPVTSEISYLNPQQLGVVSEILGRNYLEARVVRHRLFGGSSTQIGLSVIFKNGDVSYSEAHAGSGEVAIVSAVQQILPLEKFSLILFDEPEVSLHPGAQRRFLKFLLSQCIKKQLQIVLSTHSAEFLRGLPNTAIKVMDDPGTGKFRIRQNVNPAVAFDVIGQPNSEKLSVYVEDSMAKLVINEVVRKLPEEEQKLVDVIVYPGGSSTILSKAIPVFISSEAKNVLIYLDGDQKPSNTFLPSITIPVSENESLTERIFQTIRCNPEFPLNGGRNGGDSEQRASFERAYIDWYLRRVRFLPKNNPEEIVLAAILRSRGGTIPDKLTSEQSKSLLCELLDLTLSELDGPDELNHIAKHEFHRVIDRCSEAVEIEREIKYFLSRLHTTE